MKQDELLEHLGRLARAQAEQTAARAGDAADLLRPLDGAAHDRIVARLLPLVRADSAESESAQPRARGEAQPGVVAVSGDTPRGAAPRADVPARQAHTTRALRSRSRRWAMAAAPILAAAAALLWIVWPRADASLPGYAVELSGGRAMERGADAPAIIRVAPGDRVSAVLRPAEAVRGEVSARAFVEGRALAGLAVERSADGALRITGLGPALAELAPGRHRLWFAVGRPPDLPDTVPEPLSDTASGAGHVRSGVQLLSYEVERIQP